MVITNSMAFFALPLALMLGMLGAMEIGRRFGRRQLDQDSDTARAGLGPVEASLFGLLGLIVAFTFSGAASRFDDRRDLIVQEANAIGTAWTRLDMLPGEYRQELRDLFRRYLDLRLETYRRLPDVVSAEAAWIETQGVQQEIWKVATEACRTEEGKSVTILVLPALNAMFDITTTRTNVMLFRHPPGIIFVMLFLLGIICSLLAGYGMASAKKKSLVHMLSFALLTSFVFYVILDLEHPRLGLIQVKKADQALIALREGMKSK